MDYHRISLIIWKNFEVLIHCPSTYLCEAAFSSYASIKTTYQNRQNTEADEILVSSIKLDFKEICKDATPLIKLIF